MEERCRPATCREAKELRRKIDENCRALLATAPILVEAVEDDDMRLSLTEVANLASIARGLQQMIEECRDRRISLVGEL